MNTPRIESDLLWFFNSITKLTKLVNYWKPIWFSTFSIAGWNYLTIKKSFWILWKWKCWDEFLEQRTKKQLCQLKSAKNQIRCPVRKRRSDPKLTRMRKLKLLPKKERENGLEYPLILSRRCWQAVIINFVNKIRGITLYVFTFHVII